MHTRLLVLLALSFAFSGCAESHNVNLDQNTIEEDRKNHGHLDGHPVKVIQLLETMDLDQESMSKCRAAASASQNEYREWYSRNKTKVNEFNDRIRAFKAENNRPELKKLLPEKKKFMHTAPSLLRNPEPIEQILNEEQKEVFVEKLNELKRSLHKPKNKAQQSPGRDVLKAAPQD